MGSSRFKPRVCVYCRRPGSLSNEHVLPDWLKTVIPRDHATHTHLHNDIQFHKSGDQISSVVIAPSVAERRQHIGTVTVRNVCIACNTGWMKKIQDESIPVLTPLIRGVWSDLTPAKGALIARWYCMITANIDAVQRPPHGVTAKEREILYAKKEVPKHWSTFIGRLTGGDGYSIAHRSARALKRVSGIIIDGEALYFQVTTVQLGQLLLHTTNFDVDQLQYGRAFGLVPIAPWGGRALDWKTAPFLTGKNAKTVANELFFSLTAKT